MQHHLERRPLAALERHVLVPLAIIYRGGHGLPDAPESLDSRSVDAGGLADTTRPIFALFNWCSLNPVTALFFTPNDGEDYRAFRTLRKAPI